VARGYGKPHGRMDCSTTDQAVVYRFGCLLLKRAKMIKIQTTLGGA
jgi:hypothetical protein